MRLLADENVPLPGVVALRILGHDVASVSEDFPGAGDPTVLARARAEGRLLVTFDRDFGELVFRTGEAVPPGILYLRFRPASPTEVAEVLETLMAQADVSLEGAFTVVDRERVRQRRLPPSQPAGE